MSSPAKLTPHNAIIKTATVQIKSLTVSGKRVTQSVFKQLQEKQLIAEDGTLNGQPWGTVNYHPDKQCDSRGAHMHVVWQRGDELFRSWTPVVPQFDDDDAGVWIDDGGIGNRLLAAMVRDWLRDPEQQTSPLPTETVGYSLGTPPWERTLRKRWTFDGSLAIEASLDTVSQRAVTAYQGFLRKQKRLEALRGRHADQEDIEDAESNLAEAQEQFAEALALLEAHLSERDHGFEWPATSSELQALMEEIVAEELTRRENHRTAITEIKNLDQLFIAL